jgi:hypothetical protein
MRVVEVAVSAALVVATYLCLTGCSGGPTPEQIQEEFKRQLDAQREAKLGQLRSQVSTSFFFGAVGYVCIGLLGPSAAELGRRLVVTRFKLSIEYQVAIAKFSYGILVGVGFFLSLTNSQLRAVQPAVWLLLGATSYPFFVHVIPSLEAGDKMRRKAGVAQIKSFAMLIFVFYIVLRLLSPEGLGEIKVSTTANKAAHSNTWSACVAADVSRKTTR